MDPTERLHLKNNISLPLAAENGKKGTESSQVQIDDAGHIDFRQGVPSTMQPNDDRLLTVPEIAERLRVPPSWVYRHSQMLGAFKVGKYLRFRWTRVLESLEKLGR
jgi:hypothetical protein